MPGLALSGNERPTAGRFAGKFQNEKLTVVISVEGSACDGIIILGDKRFPLTGRIGDEKLEGTFISDGNRFSYSATLSGNELTFVTGNTTYVLKNANPLAQESNIATTVPATPVKSGEITGKWKISGDPGEEKFTLTLGHKGDLTVETSEGNISNQTYSFADDVLTFDGDTSINRLSLAGKWKLTWKDQDTFTTTDNKGRPLTLHRVK